MISTNINTYHFYHKITMPIKYNYLKKKKNSKNKKIFKFKLKNKIIINKTLDNTYQNIFFSLRTKVPCLPINHNNNKKNDKK